MRNTLVHKVILIFHDEILQILKKVINLLADFLDEIFVYIN